jgi:hypothetical protein
VLCDVADELHAFCGSITVEAKAIDLAWAKSMRELPALPEPCSRLPVHWSVAS